MNGKISRSCGQLLGLKRKKNIEWSEKYALIDKIFIKYGEKSAFIQCSIFFKI